MKIDVNNRVIIDESMKIQGNSKIVQTPQEVKKASEPLYDIPIKSNVILDSQDGIVVKKDNTVESTEKIEDISIK